MTEIAAPATTTAAPAQAATTPEAAAPPKDMTAAEKKIWKLKADGQEFDFDASDEAAIKREIEKARGASKRFEEAATMRRQAEHFIHLLKTDPEAILTNPNLGLDFKKIAEEYLWKQIQEEKMTPEERHQREVERRLKEYQEKEESAKKEAEEAEFKQLVSKYEADFEQKVLAALDSNKVPRSRKAVRRMGEYMRLAMAHNIEIKPEDLVNHVRQEMTNEDKEIWEGVGDESLLDLVGEKLAKRIRDIDLKRLKSTQGEQFKTPPPKPVKHDANGSRIKKVSSGDWRKQLLIDAGIAKRRS
jgi:hypothetical protein